MERDAGCTPRTLAQGAVGQVLLCGHCSQVHLQLGPVTLRLTREAFAEVVGLVQSARRALEAPAPDAGVALAATAALH